MGAIYKHMKVTFYRVNQIAFCKETLTTFGLYPTIRLSLCHPERSGIAIKWRTKKPMNAAQSNPEGAPAGGISALTQGASIYRASYVRNTFHAPRPNGNRSGAGIL